MNAEKLAWGPGLPAVLPWVDASPLWVPRLCLTWVSRSRVHITEATLKHLDKAYEVEDGHGQQRDPYLKEMNIRTYLVIDPRVRGLGGCSWGGSGRAGGALGSLACTSEETRMEGEVGKGPAWAGVSSLFPGTF